MNNVWPLVCPYPDTGVAVGDGEFIGRETHLKELRHAFEGETSRIIVLEGPRRIGKTSILRRFEHDLTARATVIYADVRDLGERTPIPDLSRIVLLELASQLAKRTAARVEHAEFGTPDAFRANLLPALLSTFAGRRIVLLLDEVDWLAGRSQEAIQDLLRAFRTDLSPAPLLVLAVGRPFGETRSEAVGWALKHALELKVGPFEDHEMEEAEHNARAYTFTQEARDAVRTLTAGHPLYVMGVHQAIYTEKFSNDNRRLVTVHEVLHAIDKSHGRIGDSLEHAWDQLTPTQSNFGRALAEILGRADDDPSDKSLSDSPSSALSGRGVRYLGSATLEDVARELETIPELDPPSVTDLQIEAKGLQESYVLKPDGDRYRLYSPYLGYWLRKHSYDYLNRNRREAGGLVGQAKSFLEQGDRVQALQALESARALDYSNPEASILLAEIEEAEGNNEEALRLLRGALRRRPKDIQPLLIGVVEKLMREAIRDGRDPRIPYRYLHDLGSDRLAESSLSRFLIDHFLNRWEQALRGSRIQEAAEAFGQLALEDLLPVWRKRALERYAALALTYFESEERARNCLIAVRDVFVQLTGEIVEEETGSDVQLRVLDRLGTRLRDNPDALDALCAEKAELQAVAPWWVSTLKVLEHGMERHLDEGEARLGAETLRLLAYRVPKPLRDDLIMCYQQHLPGRIRGRLREDPEEASQLVRLLIEYGPLVEPEMLWSILDEHVLELEGIPDDKVAAFFEECPRIYESFLKPGPDGRHDLDTVRKVSDQCVLILERMHRDAAGAESVGANWTRLLGARTSIEQWVSLIDHLAKAGSSRVDVMRALTAVPVEVLRRAAAEAKPAPAMQRRLSHRTLVVEGANLELGDEFPLNIPGVDTDFIKRYMGTWKKETVIVKHYLFPLGQSAWVHAFVQRLWDAEQRVLFDVATRRRGRAFSKLLAAGPDPEAGGLIMITEFAGHRTLRNLIDQSHPDVRHPARRGALWRELLAVMEAVGTLHSANFLHRMIRPENILVSGEADGLRLKLVNFEWSVYLHALSAQYPGEGKYFDVYSAPEILENHIGSGSGDAAGENFGADVYALGLVFFESLVRRLTDDEHGYYKRGRKYDRAAHRGLIKRLQREAHVALPTDDERLLIRGMLEFNLPRLRLDDTTIDVARRIAFRVADIQEKINRSVVVLSATANRGTPESIENFLPREFRIEPDSENLKLLLCKELAGARIYRNAGDPSRPLFIECRGVTFVASPFEHKGIRYQEVPFLNVAWTEDQKTGPLIARLPENVQVVDIQVTRKDLDERRAATLSNGEAWRRMFEVAATDAGKLAPEQREFHTILRVSAAVERELWQQQVVPYRLLNERQDDGFPCVTITTRATDGPARGGLSLSQFITRQMGREETDFDLGRRQYALAPFADRGLLWRPVDVDTTRDVVILVRNSGGDASSVPNEGFLRPSSLSGNRALHERRQELLTHLEDDDFLLGAVYKPEEYFSDNGQEVKRFVNTNLDEDKKRIVRRVMSSRPLFVVQGPPGTGKTTLAAEVIQQELARRPSSRILVTSQAHEPLNNLMFRVTQAVSPEKLRGADQRHSKDESPLSQVIAVRLPPPRGFKALHKGTDDESARDPAEKYYPDAAAERCLQMAQRWSPQTESRVTPHIVDQWLRLLKNESQQQSVSLAERIVSAANLVYATANDRSLNRMGDFEVFDLLIFEEAAKAYPLEVLGPMRRARRWLLIGDQNQLPPFNIEEFRDELDSRIAQALNPGIRRGPGGSSSDAAAHLNLTQRSAKKARDMADFFAALHERGMRAERQFQFADRLTRQWRMHPSIGNMLKTVYYPFLENGDESYLAKARQHNIVEPAQLRGQALVWIDIPEFEPRDPAAPSRLTAGHLAGEELSAGGGFRNYFEFNAVMQFLWKIRTKGYGGLSRRIAFLAPYWAQVRLINESLLATWESRQTGSLKNLAFTVDSFQGRQSDVVVVSLVRNNVETGSRAKFGFLESEKRAGVMFSRAESLLVVVGCSAHFRKDMDGHIARVFDYISKHGVVISATDLLEPSSYQVMERLLRGRQLKRGTT